MIVLQSYWIAILFCVFAMVCWGSWQNTQKMVQKGWRFELFYWDLTVGILIMATIAAFTVGSLGETGRPFLQDITTSRSLKYCLCNAWWFAMEYGKFVDGCCHFGCRNVRCISHRRRNCMGTWNYSELHQYFDERWKSQQIIRQCSWLGIVFIVIAIFLSGKSYKNLAKTKKKTSLKGIILSVLAGTFIAFFFPVVVNSLDPAFVESGKGSSDPLLRCIFYGNRNCNYNGNYKSLFYEKPG